jgi:hypothetical protein
MTYSPLGCQARAREEGGADVPSTVTPEGAWFPWSNQWHSSPVLLSVPSRCSLPSGRGDGRRLRGAGHAAGPRGRDQGPAQRAGFGKGRAPRSARASRAWSSRSPHPSRNHIIARLDGLPRAAVNARRGQGTAHPRSSRSPSETWRITCCEPAETAATCASLAGSSSASRRSSWLAVTRRRPPDRGTAPVSLKRPTERSSMLACTRGGDRT